MPPLDLGSLLQKYLDPSAAQSSTEAAAHFDQVAQNAPDGVLGQGIADALRSDQTPSLGQMVSQMFSQANPQQQAGMLNQILNSLGPGALAALGGGALGGIAGPVAAGQAQVTPQQASQVTPQQVQDLANHAEQHSPNVFDKLGSFYAEHPGLVKTLGSAALAIALSKIANRQRG